MSLDLHFVWYDGFLWMEIGTNNVYSTHFRYVLRVLINWSYLATFLFSLFNQDVDLWYQWNKMAAFGTLAHYFYKVIEMVIYQGVNDIAVSLC